MVSDLRKILQAIQSARREEEKAQLEQELNAAVRAEVEDQF